jgi:uncharacterized protein (TIGR00369 family)
MTLPILNEAPPLETFRKLLSEGQHTVPLGELLGFRLVEIDPGRAVVELEAGPRHANIIGTLHGGVIATIADSAMGLACAATLAAGETCTTVDLKVNFLRPFEDGILRAVASVLKRGRTLGYVECDVVDSEGRLIARSSSTCMVLRG